MTFTVARLAAGCAHCQAHGAFGLDKIGLSLEKVQVLWSFQTSDLFSDCERAVLCLGLAGGSLSSAVGPEH